mmetsp:Transcript_21329/g.46448  ORF Transcript_21329/g.46448 Transcript_21329/m.46448 type:complete len:130 (-) Transcript_21329:50-439(-)
MLAQHLVDCAAAEKAGNGTSGRVETKPHVPILNMPEPATNGTARPSGMLTQRRGGSDQATPMLSDELAPTFTEASSFHMRRLGVEGMSSPASQTVTVELGQMVTTQDTSKPNFHRLNSPPDLAQTVLKL